MSNIKPATEEEIVRYQVIAADKDTENVSPHVVLALIASVQQEQATAEMWRKRSQHAQDIVTALKDTFWAADAERGWHTAKLAVTSVLSGRLKAHAALRDLLNSLEKEI